MPSSSSRLTFFVTVAVLLFAFVASAATQPLPPLQSRHVPKPSGAPGNLKVLDWAGYKSAVTYTFDDGLASQAANYPQLHATGIRMTFFVHLGAPDPATWTQMARDGNEIANHTAHHCHADGTGCKNFAGSLEAEYDLCTDYIKKTFAVSDVYTTASPFGDTGFDSTAKTRFFLNRGVWGGQVAPADDSDPFNLRAFAPPENSKAEVINNAIDSARAAGHWQILLLHSLGGDGGYAPVNISEIIASINHAKSTGDVWIDTMVNVGAYWMGQKALTAATATQSGKDTVLTWTLPPRFPPGHFVRVTVSGGKLRQNGKKLKWNPAGYYEVALDPGSLTISK